MMVNQNLIRYITLSVYDPVISNALEIIGRKNVHLVDGVNIVENPKEEFLKLLKFLGAHDLIDFEFNEEKGMGSKIYIQIKCRSLTDTGEDSKIVQRRVENFRVHFWTFSPVSVKSFLKNWTH